MNHITLIGVGNEFRQDDGVGLLILKKLRHQIPDSIATIEASGEGTELMQKWQDNDVVYVFDAVCSGEQAGTIYRIEAENQPVPTQFFNYSTHAFSVAEAVELSRTLEQLPNHLIIYGVEGKKFAMGTGLSEVVEYAATEVVERVLSELENYNARSKSNQSFSQYDRRNCTRAERHESTDC